MKTKSIFTLFIVFFMLLTLSNSSYSQSNGKKDLYDSMQVLTINGIITAVYDLISGPAGDRNWDKFRFLCLPEATFININKNADGTEEFFIGSIDDYIEKIRPTLLKSAYYENEVERNIHSSDNIANVFSTYQSVLFLKDGATNQKGVNSFQLIYKKNRWWIVNILWKNEPFDAVSR